MMSELSHKARTRQRILEEAAAVMRVVGTDGIGVAALMKRVGLTHGGFYAHFTSRDDLVANVIDCMFSQASARLQVRPAAATPAEKLMQTIDLYLSWEARNAPEQSCPLPALTGEAGRLPPASRARFADGILEMQQRLAGVLGQLGHDNAAQLASSVQAELVGAMALARAMPDELRAREILQNSRHALLARLLPGSEVSLATAAPRVEE